MTKSSTKIVDKGGSAEEALRRYFLQLGSFVVRGVPLRLGGEDITDVDLWVYTRASAHARHICIVDVKNKKRAKAFERAIWVKGLQSAIGADEAIIATTGRVEALVPFASKLDVRVLSASTFTAIINRYADQTDRLSSEQLLDSWRSIKLRDAETLKSRFERAVSELAHGITFSALNSWIDDAAELFQLSMDRERQPGELLRGAYFFSSLVAIGGDYLGRNQLFSDTDARVNHFKQGLLFGRTEADASRVYVEFAEQLVTEFLDQTGASAAAIRTGFEKSVAALAINGLVEFFAKPAAGKELVDGGIQLERAAFSADFASPSRLEREARTIIGLVLDYAGLPRGPLLGGRREEAVPPSLQVAPNKKGQSVLPFERGDR